MKIYLLIHDHKQGTDHHPFMTEEEAMIARAEIIALSLNDGFTYYSSETRAQIEEALGQDDWKGVFEAWYDESNDREWLTIEEANLDGKIAVEVTGWSQCQNCTKIWPDEQVHKFFPDVFERISPGEIFPTGECPDCGALCQICPAPEGEAPPAIEQSDPELYCFAEHHDMPCKQPCGACSEDCEAADLKPVVELYIPEESWKELTPGRIIAGVLILGKMHYFEGIEVFLDGGSLQTPVYHELEGVFAGFMEGRGVSDTLNTIQVHGKDYCVFMTPAAE